MRFFADQTFRCPMPGCGWMVVAETGDTFALIERILTSHAHSHDLHGDEAADYVRLMHGIN